MIVKEQRIQWSPFSSKHKKYIKNALSNKMNVAEGAIRSGKTIDHCIIAAAYLETCKDKIHLASGSSQPNAKLNIGECNGFGLEHLFRGRCKWGKFKDNEALFISTQTGDKIVVFAGGGKADSYKKILGNSYGLWIATEINEHFDSDNSRESFIKVAMGRQLAAQQPLTLWDLNPCKPRHPIYLNYIDKWRDNYPGGYQYELFTIYDNLSLSKERIQEIEGKYEVGSIWYKRDILGQRVQAEGLVFSSFAERTENYIIDKKEAPKHFKTIGVGYDLGGNKSNFALIATGITLDNTVVVLRAVEIVPEDMKLEDVEQAAIDFIEGIEKDYGNRCRYCYIDDNYYTTVNSLNNWRYIFDSAARIKGSMPLGDRPLMLTKLMAQGRFKLVEGECEPLIYQLQNAVFDDKAEKAVICDDGSMNIDCIDGFFYSIAEDYLYLTD